MPKRWCRSVHGSEDGTDGQVDREGKASSGLYTPDNLVSSGCELMPKTSFDSFISECKRGASLEGQARRIHLFWADVSHFWNCGLS